MENIDIAPKAPTAIPIVTEELFDLELRNGTDDTIILRNHFDDPFTTGRVARFELYDATLGGGITEVLLFDQADAGAPISTENFENYVEDGDYANTIIHRSVSDFIIQGGGFTVDGLANTLQDPSTAVSRIPADAPIQNEFSSERSNIRGTIAFAKLGNNPNSATNQWFFNLDDNSSNLDNQNGGFTVFGEVLGLQDLEVLEAIAALPTSDQSTFFNEGAFTDLPLIFDDPTNPTITSDDNLVRYQNISISQRDELAFEVVSNSNPAIVSLNLSGGDLEIETLGELGTTTITVRATNLVGAVVEDTFTITVNDTEPTDAVPTTDGIADITVDQDSDNTVISLFDAFADREDTDDELIYSIVTNSNSALFASTEIDPTTGELTLDYADGQNGEAEVTVQARDTNNQTVSTTFSVTVNPDNDAPVGVPDTFSMILTEGSLVVSVADGVLNNDTVDGNAPLTASLESDPTNGSVELNSDGSFTYTPEAGFVGLDSFSYTASAGNTDSNITTVSIQVNALPAIPDDAIQGNEESNTIKGGRDADYLLGLAEGDRLRGRLGNDTIDGGVGDDNIKGQKGDDLIDGGDDNDLIRGGQGNDTVYGGVGFDFLRGHDGDDVLVGGDSNDLLHGEKGNDLLVGGNQDDYIRGGKGNDTLIGGSGNDTLVGYTGQDLYVLSADDGIDQFISFRLGEDLIGLADDLTFGALSFEANGNTTDIFLEDELLATVQQKNSGNLANQANFRSYP